MAEQTAVDKKDETSCDKDEDPYFCDVCNITFTVPKAYFAHVYSVSHLQRANAAEKQAPKARSSTCAPATQTPASTSATEAELKVGPGSNMGTEAEKVAISEHQSRAADNLQVGTRESTSNPTAPPVSNAFGSKPVDVGGMQSASYTVGNTSQTGSMPSQVVSGSMTVAPQAVSSVAVMPSDVTMTTAPPGSYELSKTSVSMPDGVAVSSSNASELQPLNSSISMPQRPPGDVTMAPTASTTKQGPLLSTPKIPSLMKVPVPRPQRSGFDPRLVIPPTANAMNSRQQLNNTVSPNQKVPLLRSPTPVSSSFSPFSDTFSAPYMGTTFAPRPTPVSHHPGPLLPTPASQIRGALLGSPVHPLMNVPTSGTPAGRSAFSRSWDPTGIFSGGDDPQPPGVTVKEYHHGRPAERMVIPSYDTEDRIIPREFADVQRNVNPPQKSLMGSHVETLIDGSWVLASRPFDDKGRIYHCQMCGLKFDEFLMHELHLAGLRHRKMAKGLISKPSGSGSTESGPFQTPYERMDVFEGPSHDPVFVTGLLDQNPTSSSAKVSASASSVCYSELEQKLRSHPDPILGVDYLTEYRFLGGRVEYSCNLCDVELKSVTEVADHVTSTHHRLHYLCYNDVETYKSVSEASDIGNSIREAAEKIEKKSSRKSRVRVKLESDDLLSDGQFAWIELKDESIRPVSALPGHRLSTTYSKLKPHEATVAVDSLDSLFQTLALHSCLAANRPPSLMRPLRRMDFITALGEFTMKSDKDAEICFQLANFLTVAVINFRRQMLPSLNTIDVSSIEKRLTTLLRNAEAVTQKIISTDSTELDITRSESG